MSWLKRMKLFDKLLIAISLIMIAWFCIGAAIKMNFAQIIFRA